MNGSMFNRMIFGLVLICAGVVFFLNQMELLTFDIGDLFSTYWPVILILFGLKGLLFRDRWDHGHSGASLWQFILIIIGAVFLGRNLGLLTMSFSDLAKYIFPLLLVLIGVRMILKPRWHTPDSVRTPSADVDDLKPYWKNPIDPKQENQFSAAEADRQNQRYGHQHHEHHRHHRHHRKHWNSNPGAVEKSGFIGDIYLGRDQWELKSMNISHFIGDTVIDLTRAHIADGEWVLNISSFIGDVKMLVPNDLDLEIAVVSNSFLGDLKVFDRKESGFFKNMNWETPNYGEASKKIKMIVSTFIGDVKVTRVG